MKRSKGVKSPGRSEVFRKDMRFKLQNPYASREKFPFNTKCPDCGAVFDKGRWSWTSPDPSRPVHETVCPACRQTHDGYAGGVLTLSGSFLTSHRDDIVNRIHNVEKAVKDEHPLQRVMSIVEEGDTVEIFTTSEHLVARLGKSLKRDFKGELEITFADEDKFARVSWKRDD